MKTFLPKPQGAENDRISFDPSFCQKRETTLVSGISHWYIFEASNETGDVCLWFFRTAPRLIRRYQPALTSTHFRRYFAHTLRCYCRFIWRIDWSKLRSSVLSLSISHNFPRLSKLGALSDKLKPKYQQQRPGAEWGFAAGLRPPLPPLPKK